MRRCERNDIPALALLALASLAACDPASPAAPGASMTFPGVFGVSFNVTVFRPTGGTVTSTDGQILCGTAADATRCGPAPFPWGGQAVLVATADPGNMLGTWAGDCTGRPTDATGQYVCVLDTASSGADKTVLAAFGPQGLAPHTNFSSQQLHGPAYLDFVAGAKDAFTCTASSCHGPTYDGAGIAPSCNACHALAASGGWTAWRSNCTFCHGTRTPVYDASALSRAAPSDAVSQRLDGQPAPTRTGRHRAHLAGRPAFPAFACATCHAVPATVDHVRADRRAPVVFDAAAAFPALGGADLAALPAPLAVYAPGASPPTCSACYCHGGTLPGATAAPPAWSSLAPAMNDCLGCHGAPPETGRVVPADGVYCDAGCSIHAWHVQALPVLGYESCDACHHGSALANGDALHVNGKVDVAWSPGTTGTWDRAAGTCAVSCHSDPTPRGWR